MAKELRIPLAIELPDDIFEQATVLAAVKPALDEFIAAIRMVAPSFTAEPEIVTPRVVAAKEEVAPAKRMRGHSADQAAAADKQAA